MTTILVIKLGALGDFIVADAAFHWIKQHHSRAKIVLLTTPAFENFAKKQGYFDEIIALPRFKYHDLKNWRVLLHHLKRLQPMRIYDLQMVNRTKIYAAFIKLCVRLGILRKSEWIGHLKGGIACLEPSYFKKHPLERFSRLFSKIATAPLPPLDITRLAEPLKNVPTKPYVLVIPNASNAFNGAKKWPLQNYRDVVQWLISRHYHVVIIGGPNDDHSILRLSEDTSTEGDNPHDSPCVIDLTGKTSFENIIALAKDAACAIGNDTGPIHMAAASQCPVFVLFSKKAPPAEQVGARGPIYHHLSVDDLNQLKSELVMTALEDFIEKTRNHG